MKQRKQYLVSWLAMIVIFLLAVPLSVAQRGGGGGGFGGGGFGGGGGGGGLGGFGGGGGFNGGAGRTGASSSNGAKALDPAQISYDMNSGTVIIYAADETFAQIKDAIKGIDQPVPQVLIKVLFLEVTYNDDLNLGVDMNYANVKNNTGTKSNTISSLLGTAAAAATNGGGIYKVLDNNFTATVQALANSSKLEVLSRPSVMSKNNVESVITVGQSVPFMTGSNTSALGTVTNTIEYSDIGIILRVTPHVTRLNNEKLVEMEVHPEISTLLDSSVSFTTGVSAPLVSKRSADCRVLVGDGRTAVIGGLMTDAVNEQVTKVPLLGDIPYVGAAFRYTSRKKSKTELLIFLTPIVLDTSADTHNMAVNEVNDGQLSKKAYTKEQMNRYLSDMTNENKLSAPPAK